MRHILPSPPWSFGARTLKHGARRLHSGERRGARRGRRLRGDQGRGHRRLRAGHPGLASPRPLRSRCPPGRRHDPAECRADPRVETTDQGPRRADGENQTAHVAERSSMACQLVSIPGYGAGGRTELAGEIGTLERVRGEASLALYLGMAPLDRSSGKSRGSKPPRHVNIFRSA